MTTFKGHKTAFNKSGSNSTTPNAFGPPNTQFKGRGSLPGGKMNKRYPGEVADISGSNRRAAKANHGEGAGSATQYCGRSAFGRNK
jgi:hypothetical protein